MILIRLIIIYLIYTILIIKIASNHNKYFSQNFTRSLILIRFQESKLHAIIVEIFRATKYRKIIWTKL